MEPMTPAPATMQSAAMRGAARLTSAGDDAEPAMRRSGAID
ncbi:Uncharacterised protein [Mycobacterium tuberculosis]|nr:Uncharacterised protein [Mycobacterium tuberculosis]